MLFAFVVDEAFLGDVADGVGENGGVGGDESVEVARCGSGTTAPWVEVLGDDFVDETRVVLEMALHLLVAEVAGIFGFLRALEDELESLVELVLHLFAILEILLGVLLEVFELFGGVFEIGPIFARPSLCEAGRDPDGTSNPVVDVRCSLGNLGDNLHATAAGTDDRDSLAFEGETFLVRRRVHQLALEVAKAGDVGPFEVVEDAASIDEELGLVVKNVTGLEVFDLEFPDTCSLVPFGAFNLGL